MAERTPASEGSLTPKRFQVVAVDTEANWTDAQAEATAASDVLQEAGEIGFASDTKRLWIADGTTDVDDLKLWSRPITKWLTSADDQTATSDIDPANHAVTLLASGTLPAASVWWCEFFLRFQGDSGGDFRFDIDVSGTSPSLGFWIASGPGTLVAAVDNVTTNWTSVTAASNDVVFGCTSAGTDLSAQVRVRVTMGSTSGVITPRFAQRASSATGTLLRRETMARYSRIG